MYSVHHKNTWKKAYLVYHNLKSFLATVSSHCHTFLYVFFQRNSETAQYLPATGARSERSERNGDFRKSRTARGNREANGHHISIYPPQQMAVNAGKTRERQKRPGSLKDSKSQQFFLCEHTDNTVTGTRDGVGGLTLRSFTVSSDEVLSSTIFLRYLQWGTVQYTPFHLTGQDGWAVLA